MRADSMRFFLCLLIVSLIAGCSPQGMVVSGAQAGYKVLTGADAKIYLIRDISPQAIGPYRSLALGRVTTDVGPICPFGVLSDVQIALAEELGPAKLRRAFPGGQPQLVANVVVRFFKQGNVFGKEPRLDLLVTFVDGGNGREVGQVYVEGLSQSPLATKAKHLAKADAEKIRDLLRQRKEGKYGRHGD
jgi:hypothetical protein